MAVSGGIDSAALLHMLHNDHALDLIVAHFNHGIREDSVDDAAFVAGLAAAYGLPYVGGAGQLGPEASEATARTHRYAFLQSVCAEHGAQAIITAHHQDDVIETAALNMIRGTKRRGLVSLQSTDAIQRPLLYMTKQAIREYAVLHHLEWVEDSTNSEMKYARNRVRAQLHRTLNVAYRAEIMQLLETITVYNQQIDVQLNKILIKNQQSLRKELVATTDQLTANEIIAAWLRNARVTFDKKTIERIYDGLKNLQNGSKIDIDRHYYGLLTKYEIVLTRRESV